mmetsp:Transcript_4295/g.6169  ORF Transcript_4295/g.6169 Transcript_4295/m.6169 type:complete len:145 (-) Transcript_4295:15-449(-)
MAVQDMLLSTCGSNQQVYFRTVGEPVAQNGWKLAWKNRRPHIYDSLGGMKAALRAQLVVALEEFEHSEPYYFPRKTLIQGSITFNTNNFKKKDLDNMAKFILDAMEGAIYDDDRYLVSLVLKKKPLTNGQQPCTDVHLETSTSG